MVVTIIALIYISAALFMLEVLKARVGYEDETGFHFGDPMEDLVVAPDETRPAWFTGALAERLSSQRVEIFAGSAV